MPCNKCGAEDKENRTETCQALLPVYDANGNKMGDLPMDIELCFECLVRWMADCIRFKCPICGGGLHYADVCENHDYCPHCCNNEVPFEFHKQLLELISETLLKYRKDQPDPKS